MTPPSGMLKLLAMISIVATGVIHAYLARAAYGAAGTFAGYVLSRTVGLPGLPAMPSAWLDPLGVTSLACEGMFFPLFYLARRPSQDIPRA